MNGWRRAGVRFWLALLLTGWVSLLAGCLSIDHSRLPDDEPADTKPWNRPAGWEPGASQ